MEKIFLQIINMSMTASYVILFVILLRLFLKKVPKIYSYSLWIIVLVRLLVPFSFSSALSMIPMNTKAVPTDIVYAPTPEIHSGIALVDRVVNNSLPIPVVGASVNPIQIWILIGQLLWLIGIAVLLIYSIINTRKLTKRLRSAKYFRENIYEVNHIETPFVFGLLRPKIYIPFGLSEVEQSYIIKHEETHIKRYDHIIKFVSFIAASIHWFNPLVWVAFLLMGKDMELACDEKVISEMGNEIKKDYSHFLLSLSSSKKMMGGSPLAFGGENTKGRIKNILNYKKPRFWATLVGIVVIVVAVIGLLSNPKPNTRLAVEEEMLIKGFLENYYAQLSYTQEEQEEIEQEMWELSTIISLDGESDKIPSEEVKPNGFYYFYKETFTPQLYDTMTRNRKIPNYIMFEKNFTKSEITDLKLKKDKDIIQASFKVVGYIEENLIQEKIIELDFVLKKFENKIYINTINGDLGFNSRISENQASNETAAIKKDINYDKISAYMKGASFATFSPYYELLEFNISNYEEEVVDGTVHATFFYQVIEKNYDKDPDTVGYIKDAKESGNSNYQQMYDEYLEPREMNFDLKIIIDEKDKIVLYSNASPNGVEWVETGMSDYILSKGAEVTDTQD
ncbi:MAG TPA: hypothetical protein GX707_08280 [Epulopiscium sp.]|nr:hypothetical protein [Candidatus Epulonipiscium sp.]